jgi:putative hydrolase of the HAD superfamily
VTVTVTDRPTVLWDIGGVIVDLASIRAGYTAFVGELAADCGFDPDDALERWKATLGDHFRDRRGNRYRLAREGYAKATAALFDGEPPPEWELRLETAIEEAVEPEAGAVETIATLFSGGFELAIVSDIDTPEARLLLDTLGVRDHFDHVTTSEAVGYTKPDERMFLDAIEATDADPSRTVMIGDRYDHDIAGAAELGIETIGYGPDARGPKADHEIGDLRAVLDIVGADS